MAAGRDGFARVSLGSAKELGLRLVARGWFGNLSEACRAGLRRMSGDGRLVDRLVALGEEGLESGVALYPAAENWHRFEGERRERVKR